MIIDSNLAKSLQGLNQYMFHGYLHYIYSNINIYCCNGNGNVVITAVITVH